MRDLRVIARYARKLRGLRRVEKDLGGTFFEGDRGV